MIVANGQEPIVAIPVVVVVVQVRVPLGTVPVEVADVPVAVERDDRTCRKQLLWRYP